MHSENEPEPSQELREGPGPAGSWIAEMFEWVDSCAMAIVFVVLMFTFVARTSVVNGLR
jgi:signal peptidase I